MRSIDNWLDRFAARNPRFGIPDLMRYIVIGNIAVYILDQFSGGMCTQLIGFWPALIMRGQIWRLVTFIIVPERTQLLWFAISLFFYYFLGATLEREWGTSKFTLFYICGVVLTVAAGFIGGAFMGGFQYAMHSASAPIATMSSVNFSLFLAFATLYPDAQIRVYFIIPVKAKWLAILYVALTLWNMLTLALRAPVLLPSALPPALASLLNYAIFFWSDIARTAGRMTRMTTRSAARKTTGFKAAQKHAREKKGYLHKCAVCGKTDTDYPGLEFRYCSKCNGYYCYCMEHINSHVHIQ